MSEPRKLKAVEQYGQQYVREYLAAAQERRQAITTDPLEALAFMYGKMFMRGRRDKVSAAFRDRTLDVLYTYRSLEEIDLASLDIRLRERQVNNRYDRRMVRESIEFASGELQDYGCNVFNWAVASIRDDAAVEAYRTLTAIFAIRDKLATFFLRDVVLVARIEDSIRADNYGYFQPVDTWVKRIARSLEIIGDDDLRKTWTVKSKIIDACLAAGVSPLLFNAGAWMVGANAYRLLLERL